MAIDPTQLLATEQEEAKDANDSFREFMLKENQRLLAENAALSNVRVENERLKVHVDFSIIGDGLLTAGSIGFGILGIYGQDLQQTGFNIHAVCLGATLLTAIVGFGLKAYIWFKQLIHN